MKTMRMALAVLAMCLVMGGVAVQAQDKEAKKLDLPWKAEDLKKSMKKGMTTKYKMVTKTGEEEEVSYMLSEILEVTENGYKSKTSYQDAEGKAKGEATEEEKTWDKMFEGLEFTDKDTKITDEKVKVTAGEFACKLYTTTKEENGGKTTMKMWFVTDKPGHIAKFDMSMEMGEFKYSMSMELVETKG